MTKLRRPRKTLDPQGAENIRRYLTDLYDGDFARRYFEYASTEKSTYLRVNTLRTDAETLRRRLREHYRVELEPIDAPAAAFRARDPERLLGKTFEQALGHYYMQSRSSMTPPLALDPQPGERVLDLCAAPGSKSTQIAAMMENRGMLVVNEIQADRLSTLIFSLDRMGIVNAGATHERGEWISQRYDEFFDKALVDVPCTGLGILVKQIEVSDWWTAESARKLADLQFRLALSALKALKVGGEMVYSTCTMTVEENEAVIAKLLERYPVEAIEFEAPVATADPFDEYGGTPLHKGVRKSKRILPWEIMSEGFFIAKLRKTGSIEPSNPAPIREKDARFVPIEKLDRALAPIYDRFGMTREDFAPYRFIQTPRHLFFVSEAWAGQSLPTYRRVGVRFGQLDSGGGAILSTTAARIIGEKFRDNVVELETDEEIRRYVEGGTLKRDAGEKGQLAVAYRGEVIGSAQATPGGVKSRFPKALRANDLVLPNDLANRPPAPENA